MTNKAYELIQLVLKYGYVNFKGGSKMIDWNEFAETDNDIYEQICKAIEELDKGEKK